MNTDKQTVNVDFLQGKLRDEIVKTLQAEELTAEQQDELILRMSTALLDRASLTLMSHLPADVLAAITKENAEQNPQAIIDAVTKHVPNSEKIIQEAFKDGLTAYTEALKNAE